VRLAAAAAGALVLAGGIVMADGENDAAGAAPCLSYREAKAKWPGAYLTWRYHDKKWQCWAPKGVAFRASKNRPQMQPAKYADKPRILPVADDIAPEFPQPGDLKINPPPVSEILNPAGMDWVWRSREPFEPRRMGDEIPVYSTFPPGEEPPDIWPEIRPKLKTAGNQGLPAVWLMLAFLAGGMFLTIAAVVGEAFRPPDSHRG